MTTEILMPALSPTMEEGKLAKWLVKEGDKVSAGDIIAEIETDKATMEFEAVDEGILAKIIVAEGTEGVLVNSPIAMMADEATDNTVDVKPIKKKVQTYEGFQDRARSAMKRVMGKKEKQEKPRDAGAIAAKIMRNKEHHKYVNFLDVDD